LKKIIDFIHIGDYKTGTTWLQKNFYPKHEAINYLGGPFKNHDIESLLYELIESRDLDFEPISIRNSLNALVKDFDSKKPAGICREVFSGSNFISCSDARKNAERLYSIFGEIKIIFIIREQISMIHSIYSQYLKEGGSLKIENFVFDPIIARGLIERLKWHKQIKMYKSIFGDKNVHIDLFENFKNNKKIFLSEICNFLEIKNIETITDNRFTNKSLTFAGSKIQRLGNRFLRSHQNNSKKIAILKHLIRFLTIKKRYDEILFQARKSVVPNYPKFDSCHIEDYALNLRGVSGLRKISEKFTIGKPVSLPQSIINELKSEFVDSNKILFEKYELPIQNFGYAIE
jgi:hypothetical protein